MNDKRKTKAQLIAELTSLRQDFAVVQKREDQLQVAKSIGQYHAEETLQESEDRWLLALSGSNLGVWDWNLKTFSPAAARPCWGSEKMKSAPRLTSGQTGYI
jgi:hypothetical protein